jgi:mono/diheme cytochrome c family protein
MRRWVTLLVVAGALVIGGRAYARLPSPEVIHLAKPPIPASAAARGRVVYERYGCRMCHGDDGKGGFANPNAETDGKVPGITYVKLIRTGTPRIGLADPKGPMPPYRMPSWGDRMSAREVDDLVQYLLSLYPASAEKKWR